MPKVSGPIDWDYAEMLLQYSRTVPIHGLSLERFQERYWYYMGLGGEGGVTIRSSGN